MIMAVYHCLEQEMWLADFNIRLGVLTRPQMDVAI